MVNIGIVGYSSGKFDEKIAKALMAIAFDIVEENHPSKEYMVVSGLTDMGIPSIAYNMAKKRGWKTMGVACSQARDYDCFPVDEEIIEGDEWGDESSTFLDQLDVFIRIGGGEQSLEETEAARSRKKIKGVYEYDLPEKK